MVGAYRSDTMAHNPFDLFESNASGSPCTEPLGLKLREPLSPRMLPSSSSSSVQRLKFTRNELNTVHLLKSIAATQSQKCTSTVTVNTQQMTPSLGANKSYYSSTRSFTSKIVDRSKLSTAKQHQQQPKTLTSKTKAQQSIESSSGASSVESTVPKYNNDDHCFMNGSKKRIYSSVRITKKELPYTSINCISTVCRSNQRSTVTKKQMKDTESCASDVNNSHVFSSKFPQGMPFEDEFYHKRSNSISTKSEVSDYGSFDDGGRSLLPHEGEFSRQRPSNEDFYVDFSKRFSPSNKSAVSSGIDNSSSPFIGKFVCHPNEVIVQDQPVVYVAVKWWASDCNHDQNDDFVSMPVKQNNV